MAFGWHVGSFTKSVATSGFPFNQDITAAAITDTPKLVIIWSSFTTAHEAYQDSADSGFTIGFATQGATAGKMHSAGMFEDDGAGSSASWRWLVNNSATAWMRRYSPAGTLASEFYLNTELSNGFRITYNANDARADIYNYLVMWGSDITVNSGTFNARTTVGSDTIAHGLGTAPKFVMQISGQGSGDNTNNGSGQVCIGMASSTTAANQQCIAVAAENGRNTMDTWRYMPADKALGILDATLGSIDGLCTISTMDSTNFVDNWSDACSGAWRISWLAITGGSHDVHTFSAPASPGNTSKTGMSFEPVGIFGFSRGATATTTSDAHARIAVGAAKGAATERSSLYASEDNTANCESLVRSSTTYMIETNPTAIAAAASSTAAPEMQIGLFTFNAAGYTLDFNATLSGAITAMWAFAGSSSTAYNATVNESVNVTEQMQRNIAVARPVSESVSVSDATKMGVSRSVAESVTVTEDSITRQFGASRTVSESVSIEEVADRSGVFDRGLSDTPVNVTEDIFRNVTISQTVSESVTVSEQITGAVGFNRVVNETVTVLGELEFNLDDFDIDDFGAQGYEKVRTLVGAGGTVNESVTVSEQITANFGYTRTIGEEVTVSDIVSRLAAYQRSMSESVNVSDLVSGGSNVNYFRVVEESVSVSELATGHKPTARLTSAVTTSQNDEEAATFSEDQEENIQTP